jgi:hypothetical protein
VIVNRRHSSVNGRIGDLVFEEIPIDSGLSHLNMFSQFCEESPFPCRFLLDYLLKRSSTSRPFSEAVVKSPIMILLLPPSRGLASLLPTISQVPYHASGFISQDPQSVFGLDPTALTKSK